MHIDTLYKLTSIVQLAIAIVFWNLKESKSYIILWFVNAIPTSYPVTFTEGKNDMKLSQRLTPQINNTLNNSKLDLSCKAT
jgi:hypothetical protein